MLRSLPLLVLTFLLVPILGFASTESDAPKATPFTVQFTGLPGDSLNEHKIRFEDLKGKVVLIDFWATWCEPCKEALPHYSALYKKYKKQGLVVIAINEDDKPSERDAYLKKTPYLFPVFADPKKKMLETFDVAAIPTVFIFDKNTKPVTFIRGFDAMKAQVLEKTVQDLLKAQ